LVKNVDDIFLSN